MTSEDVSVRMFTADEVATRRSELLGTIGRSIEEFREMARGYELTLSELELLRELNRLEFLASR